MFSSYERLPYVLSCVCTKTALLKAKSYSKAIIEGDFKRLEFAVEKCHYPEMKMEV